VPAYRALVACHQVLNTRKAAPLLLAIAKGRWAVLFSPGQGQKAELSQPIFSTSAQRASTGLDERVPGGLIATTLE